MKIEEISGIEDFVKESEKIDENKASINMEYIH